MNMWVDGFDEVMEEGKEEGIDEKIERKEVKLIIDKEEIGRSKIVEENGLEDRMEGKVNESMRFEKKKFIEVDKEIGDIWMKFIMKVGKEMEEEYLIRRNEKDIVKVMRILGKRIEKKWDEKNGIKKKYKEEIIRSNWIIKKRIMSFIKN